MGMMGGWMEVGTHLNIGVKLTINSPLGAYWVVGTVGMFDDTLKMNNPQGLPCLSLA
jgi:hypothetical protein